MARVSAKKVEWKEGWNFYRVRFRQPGQFIRFVIPEWASRAAASIAEGAKVTMGMTSAGNWYVQNVMVPIQYHPDEVLDIAEEIQDLIEEKGSLRTSLSGG